MHQHQIDSSFALWIRTWNAKGSHALCSILQFILIFDYVYILKLIQTGDIIYNW
ncbi:hypothetical protein BCR33DRAFT_723415 [Rhizoclosmatium globosum]|uniref:Uncharacterized protein n=1 Tax=Rhizoclosmatium globosum TaxID=329046 RepID=A0A1Y2BD56_9FUNG|nr:hypothetical protein BCR33DRAFT_723415 [Rhizoclosmatium globosum]|eukprot:ORY32762.1 hypothetical protein BCR33DRAFT_723415 [Rhizoclosmatium globosum]